jgi:trehalose 6-phosphate synthase
MATLRPLAALALAVLTVFWVRALGGSDATGAVGTALAIGFTLLGAWIAGDLLRRLRLPRLTGYILFGVLIGPGLGVITETMTVQLQPVTDIATTFIALIAGLTLNVQRPGRQFIALVRLTAITLAVAMAGLALGAWLLWPWLPIEPGAVGLARLVIIALLVIITVSFSPTMTAAVATETGARGRLSDSVLTIVVLADLGLLVLFSLAMLGARLVLGVSPDRGVGIAASFLWGIGGAVAFGVLVGALFALYLRYIAREVTLVVIAVCAVLSQLGSAQQFEPLLAAVAAGLVVENLAVAQGDALKGAVQRAALPVLVIFFVTVGASLRLDVLAEIGLIALGLATLRLSLIKAGTSIGARYSGLDDATSPYIWTGLISQAGITLGFAAVVAAQFDGWGPRIQTLLVALIAIHELTGPLLFRYGLTRSGEQAAQARRPLLVVSNREPYLHRRDEQGGITTTTATGGVAVALDALMRERGGIWVAHAAGDADGEVVDASDRIQVPPDNPSYSLRRLWLDDATFAAYYNGFANEGLWPLCHLVDVRPQFRAADWAAYREVNERFAEAVDQEVRSTTEPVFIQDYHLALVAPALRARRPSVRTALFWHIPWPYPDRLRICPWASDLLAGLLANDLVAFQLERDRRNFLLAVEEDLGGEVEYESSRVFHRNRYTTVIAVPIGVDYDRIQAIGSEPAIDSEQERLNRTLGLSAPIIGIGVDRLDYTKGIPERLAALDGLLTRRPQLRGRLTFVQVGVPSRSDIETYVAIETEIAERIDDINRRHGVIDGAPAVVYHTQPLAISSLVALYRRADFCIVSSLHDGMNLVAKEFVASREDEDGVLVLSGLAGAAQELRDALIINPYDIAGFTSALMQAIDMPPTERQRRMRALRRVVAGRNVFDWASDILEGLESLWTKPLHYSVRRWEDMPV